MRCFRCAAPVPEGSRFCPACGNVVSDAFGATLPVDADDSDSLLEQVRLALAGEMEVESELGRGGMGVVFKAREALPSRAVALKVLTPELAVDARAAERFKREGRTVAELDHPNIVPVYRVGQVGNILFMAMKYIEGQGLGSIVEAQGPLPLPVVIDVLRSATRALAYAHRQGIVHRDVKGDNILVDLDGQIMVTDFGVALRASDVTLTLDGSLIGTPAFMSPEQCSGERAGPQSDQYSLGVVAFHMLSGSAPFASDTITGYIQHHLLTPVPDLRRVRKGLPPGLLAVVRRALAKHPNERFASTDQMFAAIEAVPFTQNDQCESRETLRRLVRGVTVDRIRARFVPTTEAPTLLLMRAGRSRGRRVAFATAGTTLVALAIGGLWVGLRPPHVPRDPAPAGSLGPMDSSTAEVAAIAPENATRVEATSPGPSDTEEAEALRAILPPAPRDSGTLRLFTNPPEAEILVDGRVVGVGSVLDLRVPAGRRRVSARAAGYQPLDTLVTVSAGALVDLGRIQLGTESRL